MSLTAPKDGIFLVGNFWMWGPEGPRKLQPGDTVWSGFPVGTIPDPSEMEVSIALAEADIGRIAPGMATRCILDTYPDRMFEGRIEDVGSVARESGGRGPFAAAAKPGFPVRVSLAKSDPLMRPGLSVRVEVVRASWPKALSVPRGAVRFEKEGPVVRRQGGGTTGVKLGGLHAARVRRPVGPRGRRSCRGFLSSARRCAGCRGARGWHWPWRGARCCCWRCARAAGPPPASPSRSSAPTWC